MIYVGKTGFIELTKSKKGIASVNALFEAMCPNLIYPVGDIKQLKKQIKQDGAVKGNIDKKFMMDQISSASVSSGIFDTKKMHSDLYPGSTKMLDRIGYIPEENVNAKCVNADECKNIKEKEDFLFFEYEKDFGRGKNTYYGKATTVGRINVEKNVKFL